MKYQQVTIVFVSLLFSMSVRAGEPIIVDGLFADWANVPVAVSDTNGDGFDEDFAELHITNDNDFLFLRISFHTGEVQLQDINDIRLKIDTDNNAATGQPVNGMGAELEWCFGCRTGTYHTPGGEVAMTQADLTLRSAPVVTSEEFEIAISLSSLPMTLGNSQIPDTLSLFFETTDKADLLPDAPAGFQYIIDTTPVDPVTPIPLSRQEPGHVRVLTYNTLQGGILISDRQPHFQRIFEALLPDIIAFQEQTGAEDVKNAVADWIQDPNLHTVGLGNDHVVVSKYPILNQAVLINSGRTIGVLLDTEIALGSQLLIINSHLSCCANNSSRQQDSDEIIRVLREWRSGNGPFPLPDNTPIIHLGDFNLVGLSRQLTTLRDGDIADEFSHGPDFSPDWDGTPLADLFSRHTSIRMGYTWRNDFSEFSPGKLDYILYTDSNLELGGHFVLNTLAMSEDELATYGLMSDDTNSASDHLPRVMDIASVVTSIADDAARVPGQFELFPAFPNPFNPVTTIKYAISAPANITLIVYDITGREVALLVDGFKAIGEYQAVFDAEGLASGLYIYRLAVAGRSETRKFLLLK